MSTTVYIIRDHYQIYHQCDESSILKIQIEEKNPGGKLLEVLSCGVILEYFWNTELPVRCDNCGEGHILTNKEFEHAREPYERFWRELKNIK